MKKAFIITSSIEVDNSYPWTYSSVRSHFSNEERFRQTVCTLTNLDCLRDKDTSIFLLDNSDNTINYMSNLSFYNNFLYFSVKDKMPNIYETTRNHPNKSYCEQLILSNFLDTYKQELSDFDFLFKLSGRYLIDKSFDINYFNHQTPGGYYFKKPLKFEWNNNWHYNLVDNRAKQNDNFLYQYCSVLYGWSKDQYDNYLNIAKVVTEFCCKPHLIHYDIETLLYFFTRQYESQIQEMPWIILGWDGTSGRFLRY